MANELTPPATIVSPLQADDEKLNLATLTAQIVSAYCMGNSVATASLPAVIATVHETIAGLGQPAPVAEAPAAEPAVPVKKSVHAQHLVCLDCGLSFKSLKRHLRVSHALTPEEYRRKWDLDESYPMVAPEYAKFRSEQAVALGLGRRPAAPEPVPAPVKPARKNAKAETAKAEAAEPAPAVVAKPVKEAKPAKEPKAAKPTTAKEPKQAAAKEPRSAAGKEPKSSLPPFRYPANRFAKKTS